MRSVLVAVCLALFCISAQAAWVWSEPTTLEYVYYSYAAYCNTGTISNWTCKWCQEPQLAEFVPTAFPTAPLISGYGYVGYHPVNHTIVVSFRGSNDLQNWIIDIESARKVSYKNMTGIEVGEGFYNEWNDLLPQVVPAVKKLANQFPSYSIWVTGHSLGAAISVLCAAELAQQGFSVNVINFGCPRVGNQNFSNLYHSYVPNTFRVVNGHDIVPHVPLEDMGFYHVSTEVWENPAESMNFKICTSGDGEDPTCSDSQSFDLSVYDHLHYLNVEENCYN